MPRDYFYNFWRNSRQITIGIIWLRMIKAHKGIKLFLVAKVIDPDDAR